ncbi:MAG: hypothetical protein B7Y80_01480 [Hyphomicrobium sp. 32-62-53]|nr:MAG: hypothetical protein B7Z29_01830 [Hyphomicrobium sp. 12-62-95]OYY01426.1 MAG: hypothetical protein B7Y80_01480 [Hyphomicrobium sp. 32-62-53]
MSTTEKLEYEFTEAGFFLGRHYNVGDRARFAPAQVKFDLHRMKLVDKPAKAPAKSKGAE